MDKLKNEEKYLIIQSVCEESGYPVTLCCRIMGVTISAYYKWKSGKESPRRLSDKKLKELIEQIHAEHPEMGYRRIKDELDRKYGMHVNDKRVLRICRALGIQSTVKHATNGCTRHSAEEKYHAENLLARDFSADRPDEKWVTDVTEFRWYEGPIIHKIYLSAIMDLFDRRIISFVISDHNDNDLVFKTFNAALKAEPFAKPLFHSDRGFQYTSRTFHLMLEKAGMTQSMSRVGKCIDNGVMEGFWSIIKREKYYGKKFISRESLVSMITEFIRYYNSERLQRCLGVLTPMEKHNLYKAA